MGRRKAGVGWADLYFILIQIEMSYQTSCPLHFLHRSVSVLYFVVVRSLSRVWLFAHGLQHTRLLSLPSLSSRVCSNSCPLSRWCCRTILSSATLFSFHLQTFSAGSFPVSQLFTSGSQSIGASASASVLPMNIQGWFPLRLTGLMSLQSRELSRVFSSPHNSKASILQHSAFFMGQLSYSYMTTGKTIAWTKQTFVGKVVSLLFNMVSIIIVFPPMGKRFLISWLQLPSAVILEPKKIKSITASTFSPSIYCEVMGPDAMIFDFFHVEF